MRVTFISITFSNMFLYTSHVFFAGSPLPHFTAVNRLYKRLSDQIQWKFVNRWLLILAELLIRRVSHYLRGPGGYRSLHVTAPDCATGLVCATPCNYAVHYRSPRTPCLVRLGDAVLFVGCCFYYKEGNYKHSWIFYSSLKCVSSARISVLAPTVYSPDISTN